MASKYEPQFTAPSGPGRPEHTVDLPLEIKDFSAGIDLFYDSIASTSPLYFATNCRSYRGRTLDRRLGYSLIGAAGSAGDKGYLLSVLPVIGGDDKLLKVTEGVTGVILSTYTTAGGWAQVGSEWGTGSDRVDFTAAQTTSGGAGRTYIANGVTTLKYTNGTTITDVTNSSTDVIGKYVVSVENIIYLANLSGTYKANQFIWTKAGTTQFYKDVDLNYASTSNLVTLDSEITGAATLGGLVYIFTKHDGLWEIDPNVNVPRNISTHGTRSPKSIAVGHSAMVWADYYGIWILTIGGNVQKAGDRIQDFYRLADFNSVADFNGHIDDTGLYKLWVGDVTYEGTAYTDCVIVFDIEGSRDAGHPIWWIDTNKESNYWTNWTNEAGASYSYFIDQSTGSTYLDGTGSDDSGSAISMVAQTKDMELADEQHEVILKGIYIKFEPDTSLDTSVTVYARGNKGSWKTVKAFTLTASSDALEIVRCMAPLALKGNTLGVKIVSSDNTAARILAVNIVYDINPSEISPVSTAT